MMLVSFGYFIWSNVAFNVYLAPSSQHIFMNNQCTLRMKHYELWNINVIIQLNNSCYRLKWKWSRIYRWNFDYNMHCLNMQYRLLHIQMAMWKSLSSWIPWRWRIGNFRWLSYSIQPDFLSTVPPFRIANVLRFCAI